MKSPKAIGLIAGGGDLPLAFAEQARARGYSLKVAAIQGEASPRLARRGDSLRWISIGQLGSLISFFKKEKVHQTVMQGRVRHDRIFKDLKFDLRALALLARTKNRSGETLLKAVAGELTRQGIQIRDSRFLMEEYLIQEGIPTRTKPNLRERASIQYSLPLARQLARAGIGQVLAVKNSAVAAVEAMEGTNEVIRRAGQVAGKGFILIKTASPRQDWRFDVPTLGMKTLENLARAGAAGLVAEAGRTFLLEKEKTIAFADRHGLFIQAL